MYVLIRPWKIGMLNMLTPWLAKTTPLIILQCQIILLKGPKGFLILWY